MLWFYWQKLQTHSTHWFSEKITSRNIVNLIRNIIKQVQEFILRILKLFHLQQIKRDRLHPMIFVKMWIFLTDSGVSRSGGLQTDR